MKMIVDCNVCGGDILVFVREDITCKHILMQNSSIEGFFIELNLKRKNGLDVVLVITTTFIFRII